MFLISWVIFWQGGITQPQILVPQSESQQGNSFPLQLFQRALEETLASFQKSIHEDMRNLHIEIIRQFHMQEVSLVASLVLFFALSDLTF